MKYVQETGKATHEMRPLCLILIGCEAFLEERIIYALEVSGKWQREFPWRSVIKNQNKKYRIFLT